MKQMKQSGFGEELMPSFYNMPALGGLCMIKEEVNTSSLPKTEHFLPGMLKIKDLHEAKLILHKAAKVVYDLDGLRGKL